MTGLGWIFGSRRVCKRTRSHPHHIILSFSLSKKLLFSVFHFFMFFSMFCVSPFFFQKTFCHFLFYFSFSKYVLYIDIYLFHFFTFVSYSSLLRTLPYFFTSLLLYFFTSLLLYFFTSLLLYFFTSSICAEMITEMRGANLIVFRIN